MVRVYKTFFFKIKIGIPTIWGRGTPPPFRNKIAEMCYLYRRTCHDMSFHELKCGLKGTENYAPFLGVAGV